MLCIVNLRRTYWMKIDIIVQQAKIGGDWESVWSGRFHCYSWHGSFVLFPWCSLSITNMDGKKYLPETPTTILGWEIRGEEFAEVFPFWNIYSLLQFRFFCNVMPAESACFAGKLMLVFGVRLARYPCTWCVFISISETGWKAVFFKFCNSEIINHLTLLANHLEGARNLSPKFPKIHLKSKTFRARTTKGCGKGRNFAKKKSF